MAGWQVMNKSGVWQFNGTNVATILTTLSNKKVCVSVLCNATAQPYFENYKRLIGSLGLNADYGAARDTSEQNIIGTWIRSGAGAHTVFGNAASWGNAGYTKEEYIFHPDGTYQFYSKDFG